MNYDCAVIPPYLAAMLHPLGELRYHTRHEHRTSVTLFSSSAYRIGECSRVLITNDLIVIITILIIMMIILIIISDNDIIMLMPNNFKLNT